MPANSRWDLIRRLRVNAKRLTSSWFQTFAVFWMLYAFFWVIPRRLNFIHRRFGTSCLFHLHRRIGMKDNWVWKYWSIYTGKGINTPTFSNLVILHAYPPIKMEQTGCSEKSACKIQTPGNYPEESMQRLISWPLAEYKCLKVQKQPS